MINFIVGLVLGFFVAYLVLGLLSTAREDKKRRGKWIMGTDIADYEYGTCSVCGYVEWDAFPRGDTPNYCPNCGADMRGENNGKK